MRVRLKGLNRISKRLADGTLVTYYYAWKGGPRLRGKLGSPEFIAGYNEALNARKASPVGVLHSIFDAYQSSSEFRGLADRTAADYKRHLRVIAAEFGDFPIAAISDRRSRGEFLAWRDRVALKSRRGADYQFAVFARSLSWAFNRGLIAMNPVERPGRLYRANRTEAVWTDTDEAAFLAKAPAHLHLALTLALWTGQRQGDLLRLTWTAYDGQSIRLKQQKTGARVTLPVGAPLKAALDKVMTSKKDAVTILTTEAGTSWTESGFRASWRKACVKAGVSGVTFHDLRGTAVTRLAVAGCSEAESATITGHSLRDVGAILDSHYLKRDGGLAESAIRKLETRTKTPN
ncbi:tyrosine-type recombinase/integrase [Brevundimonas sp.]|uniref:tyrosine-type recombinase/integrase n=1 Tax=Brevundimonas sp. TaxID=1871086 RepID=UPI002623DFDF|nr:tyrosine-type recombinase/integrase [Brevundimonas sp.]